MPFQFTCQNCGTTFTRHDRSHPSRYCSHRCVGEGQAADSLRRFFEKFDRSGGPDACHIWLGGMDSTGRYGWTTIKQRQILAHRAAWMITYGPIPDGMWVLHRCDNPRCGNPRHLFLGEAQTNTNDMISKNRKPRGSRMANAKLTESDIPGILADRSSGQRVAVIADRLHVSSAAVYNVLNGVSWQHAVYANSLHTKE